MKIFPITTDEIVAIAVLLASSLLSSLPYMTTLQGLALIYLFVALILRKNKAMKGSHKA